MERTDRQIILSVPLFSDHYTNQLFSRPVGTKRTLMCATYGDTLGVFPHFQADFSFRDKAKSPLGNLLPRSDDGGSVNHLVRVQIP